jgi:hypothetical protein
VGIRPPPRSAADKSAGRICDATSKRTPKGWPRRRSSARQPSGCARSCLSSWEIYQHTRERKQLKRRIRLLRRERKPILRQYSSKASRYKHTRGLARDLLKVWPALWTFTDHRGVEPTNNHAERALRSAVIYRKLSLGSQNEAGERRIARLLSAHTTCRLQHRSLHGYLAELLAATARGDPAPLLA